MSETGLKIKAIAEQLIPLATTSEIHVRLEKAKQLTAEVNDVAYELLNKNSDSRSIGSIMEANEWRAALAGLCIGSSRDYTSPNRAADNVKARIAFAAVSGKLPFGSTHITNLAELMCKFYAEAAQQDGFAQEEFTQEQQELHVKWMSYAISKMLEKRDE